MSDDGRNDGSPEFRAGIRSPAPRGKPLARTIGLWVFLTAMFWLLWWFFQRR